MATFLLLFVFGVVVGSFLNSVVYRLETNQQFLFGRSFCPECHHQLAWFDLIPVLSFIFLRARCRYCQKPISWQYPLVEISTALIFLLIFNFSAFALGFGIGVAPFLSLVYLLTTSSFLIAIFIFDLKHYIIPDELIYSAIGVVAVYRLFEFCLPTVALAKAGNLGLGILTPLFNSLAAAIIASAFFLAIYLITKSKGLGFGDVKLAFLMGLFLGFPDIVVALCFAFFSGAISGIVLMLAKKKELKSELPFGPFLVAGTFFALFFGSQAIDYYIHFLLS
jgi:prepilin signal peptidase PulO-like enzyme (type II secretory pathway)